MSYVVTLRNKKAVRVSDEDAWMLKNSLAEARGSVMVEVGDDMVRSTEIVGISKEQLTEADVARDLDESKLIEAKGRCRGQFSIQHEINMLAFKQHRRKSSVNPGALKWGQLIKDSDWRERIRQALKVKQPNGWCDHYANECSCEPDYHSESARHLPEEVEVLPSSAASMARKDIW